MAAKKATLSGIASYINSSTASRKNEVTVLSLQLVRAHLEYYVQLCIPHFRRDTERLKKCKRGVTRIVRACETMSHKGRLREQKLFGPDSEGT